MILIIFILGALMLLLWKWLDIRNTEELKSVLNNLARKDQHLLSNLFQAHDVKEVFTLCGGHISPILVSAEKLGIRIIDTRHEVNAVFAADAVARLRQSIGVAAVTAGPGLTNTITAVKNAQMAESPVLLLGGAAPTLLKGRGALQDIDQLVLFRPLCKFVARVTRLREIVPTLRQAILTAQEGTPGPVFVEFPVDVLYPYTTVVREIGFYKEPKDLIQKALNAYLMSHVSRQFSSAWLPQDLLPRPVSVPLPKEDLISRCVKLVCAAERPVLLIGSQSTVGPIKSQQLIKAIQSLGIPVFLGGMARGLMGKDSPLQIRHNRKEALKQADLTILAGCVCDFRLSYGRVLSKKSKIIAINRNEKQLFKNEKTFWNCDVAMQSDVASTLCAIADSVARVRNDASPAYSEWISELREMDAEKEKANLAKAEEISPDGHINPLKFLSLLDKVLPEDTILVADGGDFVGSAAYVVRPRGPLQWLDPGAFGTLGVGGGFALGAKAVFPNRPVVILWGDGSCGYSLMEYDSFCRHRLPVIGVVGNDGCWSQIAREQVPMFKSRVAVDLARTPYDEVARGLGAWGVTLSAKYGGRGVSETAEVFQEALRNSAEGIPALINVLIGTTDFREGSISV